MLSLQITGSGSVLVDPPGQTYTAAVSVPYVNNETCSLTATAAVG